MDRPVFIDIPSFVPYRDGDYWNGHRQFVEQFVNPLLLRALFGISHNAWYRGALDGIPTSDIAALIGWPKRWFAPDLLTNITLPDLLQRRARRTSDGPSCEAKPLPKAALQMVLRRLRRWIAGLTPKDIGPTEWQQYESGNTSYSDSEESRKQDFIDRFSQAHAPSRALLQNFARSDASALIILQSDHGTAFRGQLQKPPADWSDADLHERFGALNAMRLPKQCRAMAADDLTLVDTFPLVFSCLAGSTFPRHHARFFVTPYDDSTDFGRAVEYPPEQVR
jgi:hypothetical protein